MIGVADGDIGRFREWSDAMVTMGGGHAAPDVLAKLGTLVTELNEYIGEKVRERREAPQDDILSRIIEAADGFARNGAVTMGELWTFLGRDEKYAGFVAWMVADRSERFKEFDANDVRDVEQAEIKRAVAEWRDECLGAKANL